MIKKIAHLADIHLEKSTKRHGEYNNVFKNLNLSLKEKKPCRVLIVGDLFHDKLEVSNEMYFEANEMLENLSKISKKIIITTGNHDLNIKNIKRLNTIDACLNKSKLLNIYYLKKSGFYVDENVLWVLHDHLDGLNPWFELSKLKNNINLDGWVHNLDGSAYSEKIKLKDFEEFTKKFKVINLYHNPVNGCQLPNNGDTMQSNKYRNIGDFKGDILMMGDIHKKQYFNK